VERPQPWDLSPLFPDGGAAARAAERLAADARTLADRAPELLGGGSAETFVEELGRIESALDEVHDYARMRQYADATAEDVQSTVAAIQSAATDGRAALQRALDAWRALPTTAAETALQRAELAPAAYRLRRERVLAPHRLSAEAELAWAARTESARERWASLQEQVEAGVRVQFDDGAGEREWGLGDLGTVLRRPDPALRRAAYEALATAIGGIRDVLAVAWDACVVDRLAEDRLRGRQTPVQETLDLEDLPTSGFASLVEAVPRRYALRQRLLHAQADLLGLRAVEVADADAPPPGLPQLTYHEVAELAVAGLESLSPTLGEDARRLLAGGRVDGETRAGKQQYAVTFATRLDPPAYVAFRFTGAAPNVPLLAHELGHAVGLARAAAAQPPIARGWPGVAFEVPSLVAEIAAGDAFAEARPECAQAIRLVAAQDLGWSVFESVAYCLVEGDLYATRAGGDVLSGEVIQAAFLRRFGELYGPDVAFGERDALVALGSWANYGIASRFYNFQYAVGALVALALHARRDADPERFAVDYLAFLGTGRSASPAEQLRRFGLELGSSEVWEAGLAELERRFAAAIDLPALRHGGRRREDTA
jgi:oligoendopeptidase F